MKKNIDRCKETIKYLEKRISNVPNIAVILGSGFSNLIHKVKIIKKIAYKDIPHFKSTNAPGHDGNLVIATIAKKEVLLMQGRHHLYEGLSILDVVYPIYILSLLGIKQFIFTSLVGGINGHYKRGDFVIIKDHINLSGLDPLIQLPEKNLKNKFVDMFEAYSTRLIKLIEKAALFNKLRIHKGILAYLTGPTFETRSEARFLDILGADIVGWSIVPEVIVARYFDREVAGLSLISDVSNYRNFKRKKLDDIYSVGERNMHKLFLLLKTLFSTQKQ